MSKRKDGGVTLKSSATRSKGKAQPISMANRCARNVMPSTLATRALRSAPGALRQMLGGTASTTGPGLAAADFEDQLRRAFDGLALQFEIDAALVAVRGIGRKPSARALPAIAAGGKKALEEQVACRA
jgi:hypothetical protein